MSYQPDDRYWTDYLRVALPAVGLLLMLGIFWFWAASLIGGGNAASPTATPRGNVAVVTTVTAPTASATKPAVIVAPTATPTQAAAQTQPTKATTQQQSQTTQPPASTAAASNSTSSTSTASGNSTATTPQFSNGQTVTTTTDGVNMRDAPSTNGNVISPLSAGTQLKITGAPQQADGYTWYPVQDVNGNNGYVAGEFLKASGQ